MALVITGVHDHPGGQTQPVSVVGVHELGGGGELPQAELLGFPAAGVAGQGEHR
ncbi:hypothetical protein AB0P41_11585 [Streptomyces sp. NPDC079167]|uniref:hypothetical protein n=1 Tax=Streptomyces sp. NPDC079167 TaxID=3154513 RepID=UPI003424C650